jgi:hypothetical protein
MSGKSTDYNALSLLEAFVKWYKKDAETAVWVVMMLDFLCRLSMQSLAKPVREAIWAIPITTIDNGENEDAKNREGKKKI